MLIIKILDLFELFSLLWKAKTENNKKQKQYRDLFITNIPRNNSIKYSQIVCKAQHLKALLSTNYGAYIICNYSKLMKSNESHFTVYTYQFFLTINSVNLHPDIMAAKLNTYQTSQFTVLSISFEKADAVTRGRFAFSTIILKVLLIIFTIAKWVTLLSFPHVTEPRFIPQHTIICLWRSYFVKPWVYS